MRTRSRWQRLRPADGVDLVALVGIGLGLVLSLVAALTDGGAEIELGAGLLTFAVGGLVVLHGSTPMFSFLSLAGYLLRRGRVLGAHRPWVFGGVLVTVPLWFLGGLDLSVRGLGGGGALLVVWNLVALGVMTVGVVRTLRKTASGSLSRR